MFNHLEGYDPISLPTENIDGKRYYTTPEGKHYPSVTTVTGLMNRVWVQKWRDAVGEEKANRISGKAMARGSRYHHLQEDFLNNVLTEERLKEITPLDLMMFNQTKEITSKLGDIYMLEGSMYSNELEMAGRVDCVAEFAGKVSVIDFKTSTKRKVPSGIKGYFMQETAYATMFEEMYNVPIERVVTIVSVEETGQSQLFVEEPKNWIDPLKKLRAQYKEEYGL
jgi:genome maintenance exonuclease 1|tara:strand:+ start:1384 stop:2055 length:672 start_codon:yes stop_codon:yes gene_type:complete